MLRGSITYYTVKKLIEYLPFITMKIITLRLNDQEGIKIFLQPLRKNKILIKIQPLELMS